ncbi:MAG: aminopeptidase P family N-terminal domain-containing protein, partial [Dehalococcoidia bacterium]
MTSTPLSRLERIRAALAEEKLDAIYISGPVDDVYGRHSQNRFYASGFSGSSGIALITRDRAILAADFRYLEQAERQSAPRGFEVWKSEGKHAKWVGDLIRHADLCGKKIGVSRSDMTIGSFEALQKAVGDMPWGLRPEVGTASPII